MVETSPIPDITLSAGLRRDEFSNFEGATTARIAGVWTLSNDVLSATRLRASWGQGYRAPTLFELNFDQFGVTPNPDLAPERANGFDVGLEQTFGFRRTRLAATYFRQRVKDQIDFDFAGNGYFNIDRVRSEGVEVEARMGLGESLDAQIVYSLIDATDANTGAQILRTPKHSGTAAVYWRATDRLLLSADARFNGREADTPTPNDAFTRLDLRAAWSLTEAIEIYGRIENVTDTEYQDVSGYGEAGRSFFIGIRLEP
jgi:vitamin B12 transporter